MVYLVDDRVIVVLRCAIRIPIRFQHNLDAVVVLILEHVVSVRCILETHRVCNDKRWIDVSVFDQL